MKTDIKVGDKFIITDLKDKETEKDSVWIITYIDTLKIKYKHFSGPAGGYYARECTEELPRFNAHLNIIFINKRFEIETKIKKIIDSL